MKRTISIAKGKGSIGHNSREFKTENVDPKRTQFNTCYINEDIHQVYHKLFDTALEKYNAKQKRNDRKIPDYYEKIRTSKQEKISYEIVVQIGNFRDMSATDENGKIAEEILHKYIANFQKRNPTLYVFSAHLHMDEATPHLHIDYVPYTNGNKRGLETKNTLKGALDKLGFKGGTRGNTELNQWQDSEKEKLAEIMLEHDIVWEKKSSNKEHLAVLDYKKEMRFKEVAELEHEIQVKQKIVEQNQAEIDNLKDKLNTEKNNFIDISSKKARLKNIDEITSKPTLLNTSKLIVNKDEFEDVKTLAKIQIVKDNIEKKLVSEVKNLQSELIALRQENKEKNQELSEYKSMKHRLNIIKIEAENRRLTAFKEKVMKFLDILDLKEPFYKFMHKSVEKER
ncbi:Plasmid recombination enzyme [anaerobic digester metagenome]